MSALSNVKNPKMGRPTVDSEPVTVRIERRRLAVLDEWRRAQPDLPSRPEAIRRLIALGLRAAENEVPDEDVDR